MHLPVAEGPLGGHVFGDAADAARGLDHDLGPGSRGFEAEEAIPVYQDLEMALCIRSNFRVLALWLVKKDMQVKDGSCLDISGT